MGSDAISAGTRPPTPFITELETTAAALNMHINLGILSASELDLLPFSALGRHMTWKYTGDSTKPTLAPLVRLPIIARPFIERDSSWVTDFNNIIDFLPIDVRERYLAELSSTRPDPAYLDLDTFLGAVADFLALNRRMAVPVDAQSIAGLQQLHFQALPALFGKEFMSLAVLVLLATDKYLGAVGPNDPHFDQIVSIVKRLQGIISDLQTAKDEELATIVAELNAWSAQLKELAIGDGQWQILQTVVDLFALMGTTATLPQHIQSLFLALTLGLVGVNDSALTIIPRGLNSFIHAFSALFSSSPHLLERLFNGYALLAAIGKNWGEAHLSPLLYQMFVHCLVRSDALNLLSNDMGIAAGVQERNLPVFRDAVALSLLLFLIPEKRAEEFVEEMHPYFQNSLNRLDEHFSGHENELSPLITQSKVALENRDYSGFIQIQNDAKNRSEISDERQLKSFADSLWNNAVNTEEFSQTQANIGVYQG